MEKIDGYLFAKLQAIGSKSEGPEYFLQQFDYKEIKIKKHATLWQEDSALHKSLNEKVTIEGKLSNDVIDYVNVMIWEHNKKEEEEMLELELELGTNTLYIDKNPIPSNQSKFMEFTLLVKWPYRSTWEGQCPTTQIYDFEIYLNDYPIWRWSEGKYFAEVITPVSIPGPDFYKYSEVWKIDPSLIESEGTYTARAKFIASGQEVKKDFEIKFAKPIGELESVNTYHLSGDGTKIDFSDLDSDNLTLEYTDEDGKLSFSSNSIIRETIQSGSIVSVLLDSKPDLQIVILSLLVPSANKKQEAKSIQVNTFAIITTSRTSIGGPEYVEGQLKTYKILGLKGNAY